MNSFLLTLKKRILLVDDDEQILRTFTRILERAGYEVETARTAAEAKKKIRRARYAAALIDIKLPDADGTDLLLKLPKTSEVAKVIITGFPSVEYGERAWDYGADDFLVKPVNPKELLETLDRLISAE